MLRCKRNTAITVLWAPTVISTVNYAKIFRDAKLAMMVISSFLKRRGATHAPVPVQSAQVLIFVHIVKSTITYWVIFALHAEAAKEPTRRARPMLVI
jgi:hypothetical protein